jgi:hypothetical protein
MYLLISLYFRLIYKTKKFKCHTKHAIRGTEGELNVEVCLFVSSELDDGRRLNVTLRGLYPWKIAPTPSVGEAGWVPGQVWKGMEKRKSLASTGISTPDRLTRSEFLYSQHRQSYPICKRIKQSNHNNNKNL